MIHIEYPRECEKNFIKLNKESIRLEQEEEIFCSNDTAATTLTSDITPNSPVSRKNSSPHFNKRLSSSNSQDYLDQLNTQNLQSNKQQKSTIPCYYQQDGQDEKINANSAYNQVKNLCILSPTPLKPINFSQSMQNYSTSYSQASNLSSSSSSSSQSSSQFSLYSSKSTQSKEKEQQQKRILGQQNSTCLNQKVKTMVGKNLYHSDDEQDCVEEVENIYFQNTYSKRDIQSKSKCEFCNQHDQQSSKVCNSHHYRCFQDDNHEENSNLFTQISESRVRTKLFSIYQISQFTLDNNINTAINNINTTINSTNNTSSNNSDYQSNKILGANIPFQHQLTPHPSLSQNEISQDEILILESSIDRNNAQNPQSKDEEFIFLNQNSFSEDIQEQYKEFLLLEL